MNSNEGVGSGITRRTRTSLQRTSKNKTTKASMMAFLPAASNEIEESAKMECMDSLFNLDNEENNNLEIEYMLNTAIQHNEVAHVRALAEHLQLEVGEDINKIMFYIEDTKMLQDQLDWKERILNEELEVVKNDMAQYEWYISNHNYYEFKNDTWNFLKTLGRDELQSRRMKLQQMKNDLKNQYLVLHQRMRICHFLLWTLKNEEMRRKRRLHVLSFYTQKVVNLSYIVRDEVEQLQNTKSTFEITLKHGMSSPSSVEKCQSSILNQQHLGCTFDFLLRHRVNKGGSVNEYNDMVNIFERKVSVFESLVNSGKTNKLFEAVFKKQMSRLNREIAVYSKNFHADSNSLARPLNERHVPYFNKVFRSETVMDNSNVQSQKQDTKLPSSSSCLNQEQDVSHDKQSHSQHNQLQTNMHSEFINDRTCKKQENERCLLPTPEQNVLKTTEESKKQTECKHKNSAVIVHSDPEQDGAVVAKQNIKQHGDKKDEQLSSEQNKTKNVGIIKQKKNQCNRYGLRYDYDLRPELYSDFESDLGFGWEIDHVTVTKTTKRNSEARDSSVTRTATKNSVQNKNEIRKQPEVNEPTKSVTNKNKMELIKKLDGRMDSLENLVKEANLELSNIKGGTVEFQRSMEEIKNLLRGNRDREVGTDARACKSGCQNEEEKKSELLKSLKTMHTFLKRNARCKKIIEEREFVLSYLLDNVQAHEIEAFVLSAARDIQGLTLPELKQMQSKDLKLKDIAKVLMSVQDLMDFEEEDYSSDSLSPIVQFL